MQERGQPWIPLRSIRARGSSRRAPTPPPRPGACPCSHEEATIVPDRRPGGRVSCAPMLHLRYRYSSQALSPLTINFCCIYLALLTNRLGAVTFSSAVVEPGRFVVFSARDLPGLTRRSRGVGSTGPGPDGSAKGCHTGTDGGAPQPQDEEAPARSPGQTQGRSAGQIGAGS
jgi:hypothetical protein